MQAKHQQRARLWSVVLIGFLVTSSAPAQQPAAPSGQSDTSGVIAKVNGVALTRSQLDQNIKRLGLPETDATRGALKNDMIAGEVVLQAAEKAGYGDRPEVKRELDALKARLSSQLYLHDNVKPAPVTDAQVKVRYDSIVSNAGDKEYKPRVISVGDAATAGEVLAQLKRGEPFEDVARRYSGASNKAAGGEMDWITFKTPVTEGHTSGLPLVWAQSLTKLSPGGWTREPIVWNNAYIILKLDAVRPFQAPPYDNVKDNVRRQLDNEESQKATAVVVSRLIKEAKIEE